MLPSFDDTILKYFSRLEDPRIERTKQHLLIDIIALAILAVISGADSWVAIETYAQSKREWLETFLTLPNGIPSHDTIARVFALIKSPSVWAMLSSMGGVNYWSYWCPALYLSMVKQCDNRLTAIKNKKRFMSSARRSCEHRLVLGQLKVDSKSNEITAIPKLLELLNIVGCIITIDAIGCQKEIAFDYW